MKQPVYDRKEQILLQACKVELDALGFQFDTRSPMGTKVPDLPFPILKFEGALHGIDLGETIGRTFLMRGKLQEFSDTYAEALYTLAEMADYEEEDRRGRGRPAKHYWPHPAQHVARKLYAIALPPMRGFYGLPDGVVGRSYHAAEMAYVCFRANEKEATEKIGPNTYAVSMGDKRFGVLDGKLIFPDGSLVAVPEAFSTDTFLHSFRSNFSYLPEHWLVWKQISLFLNNHRVNDDLKQALCYLRHFYGKAIGHFSTTTWGIGGDQGSLFTQPGRRGRPSHRATPSTKLMIVSSAIQHLERDALISPHLIAGMCIPHVMSAVEWDKRMGTRGKSEGKRFNKKRYFRFLSTLRSIKDELEADQALTDLNNKNNNEVERETTSDWAGGQG